MNIKFIAGQFLLVMAVSVSAWGGDYGLTIDDTAKYPCNDNVNNSRNTCTSAAAIEELNRYFINNEEVKIEAVKYYINGCNGWIKSNSESDKINKALMDIITNDNTVKTKTLDKMVGCLPYKKLKLNIESELKAGSHSDVVIKRLKKYLNKSNYK